MCGELRINLKCLSQGFQELLLGRGIDGNGNARGRINLRGLLRRPEGTSQVLNRAWVVQFVRKKSLGLAIKPCLLEAADNPVVLRGIDAPISGRGGNHRLDVVDGRIVRHRVWFEAGAGWRGLRSSWHR